MILTSWAIPNCSKVLSEKVWGLLHVFTEVIKHCYTEYCFVCNFSLLAIKKFSTKKVSKLHTENVKQSENNFN